MDEKLPSFSFRCETWGASFFQLVFSVIRSGSCGLLDEEMVDEDGAVSTSEYIANPTVLFICVVDRRVVCDVKAAC